ncbi:MAG: glutathione S-transferase C-terminal domain-containing protein, partial [Devosia sp.]
LRLLEDTLTERRIAGRDWLVGPSPTIADIAVFPHVMLSHDSGIGHEDFPAINLWQRRVRRLHGFIGMPGIPDYF